MKVLGHQPPPRPATRRRCPLAGVWSPYSDQFWDERAARAATRYEVVGEGEVLGKRHQGELCL